MHKGALSQKDRAGNLGDIQHLVKRAGHLAVWAWLCHCHPVCVPMNNNVFSPLSLAFNFFLLELTHQENQFIVWDLSLK